MPPVFTASSRTEYPRFLLFHLREWRAAFLTEGRGSAGDRGFLLYSYMVSAAVGLNGVPGDAESLANLCVTDARAAEFSNSFFLLVGHEDSSNPRTSILMVKQKTAVGIEGINEKKPVSIPKNTHRQSYAPI